MENLRILTFFMKLFYVYSPNVENEICLKRAFVNVLLVSPLLLIIIPNIAYFIKFYDENSVKSVTDHIYTLGLFEMLAVNYGIFAYSQIDLRDDLNILNRFIQKSL